MNKLTRLLRRLVDGPTALASAPRSDLENAASETADGTPPVVCDHPPLTATQKAILLRRGAAFLASQTRMDIEVDLDLYRATYRWPGIVRVYDGETGEKLAESEVGRPHVREVRRHEDLAPDLKEQEALLVVAAALLEQRDRAGFQAEFRPYLFGLARTYCAIFCWPGVVRIYDADTNQLLVESSPRKEAGRVHQLDLSGAVATRP